MTTSTARQFSSRSEYRRQLKAAVRIACQDVEETAAPDVFRAISERVRAAFEAKHGPLSAVAPIPRGEPMQEAKAPAIKQTAPLPLGAPYHSAPLPTGPAAPAPARPPALVQCAGGCARWLPARPGRPVVRYCGELTTDVYTQPTPATPAPSGSRRLAPYVATAAATASANRRPKPAKRGRAKAKRPACLAV